MKQLQGVWICLLTAAAMGCAGTLDENEDFYSTPPVNMLSGGAKAPSAGRAAGAGGQRAPTPQAGTRAQEPAAEDDAGADVDLDAGTEESAPVADAGTTKPPVAASCDFRGLMEAKCGNSSCHGAPASSTGLDLTSANLAMRVAGRKGASACNDKLLVDKDNPEESMLYLKITGTDCGVKMPLGSTLSSDEQACVLSWIDGL